MGCPYTWFRNIFSSRSNSNPDLDRPANNLHVRVIKDGEEKVWVALPARSARWLIDLIPEDVIQKIYEEKIPLDAMLEDLKTMDVLRPQKIFNLTEENRQVDIWLD